ncbi:N-acetylmuramoyl-L-alanine amidase [Lederbergia citrea]|uniref:N-acetylmuramoyl-L-alanine amidase n=1 Tax=Lederbergia citrea TaxID=2833581 RepID=A0A942UNF4_9BACI|nr:N-acetylmuramoyl-L-alanine amidase [Lederbergia citrea]MBS4222542.1 N-acetylmuramoyl-L-alanine amidase [Lederbergia citrea]
MGKKLIFFIVIILVLFVAIMRYSPVTQADSASVIITGDIVNVREQPGTSYSIITQIKKGETYPIESIKSGWYEIRLSSGKKGWIADWLAKKQAAKSEIKTGIINVDLLNIRSEPSLSGVIIGKMHQGDPVKVLEEKNGWSQIEFQSGEAWANSNYIELQKNTISEAPPSELFISTLHDGTNIRKKPAIKSKIIGHASAGEVFKVIEKNDDWYKIEFDSGKKGFLASWIVSQTSKRTVGKKGLAGKMIVIDPGHGGRDQGATGVKGTLEKEVTLETARLLAQKLKASGAHVILTRNEDEYISLQNRKNLAVSNDADAFISLHYDSIQDKKITGHTSYYYYDYEKKLADSVHQNISKAVKINDRGVRYGDYYVLREHQRPSILLELGYLSNPSEEGLIRTKRYQNTIATAIYKGLADYFDN